MTDQLKIGSLFSGYGGLDLAVMAMTGGKVVWHVENASAPQKILEHHFPGVPNYDDVSTVDWSQVEPIDILTGGFPCQDLSVAGSRKGIAEGTRSGLWIEMHKAITILKPRLVVIENVKGILSAKAVSDLEAGDPRVDQAIDRPVLRAMGAVSGSLAEIGYDCKWQTLRAADAGAAHGRARVFILAYPKGA